MNIDQFYRQLASVIQPTTFYRSHTMHVSIPQNLDGESAQKILQSAGITPGEAMALINEQLTLTDAERRVGINNLNNTYNVYDRPIGVK